MAYLPAHERWTCISHYLKSTLEEHHISVPRTARYHTLGDTATARAVWIVLHGYGQLARYFLRKFEGLEKDLLIVAPEGLSRYYTDEAHRRVGATWMTREDREHEIADQITYLDALAKRLLAQCPAGTPLNVLGFSQGVATACRWVVTSASTFAKMVLWGGNMPPELDASILQDKLREARVMLVHGDQDAVVGPSVLQENEARLRMAGVIPDTLRFPGKHELDRTMLARVLALPGN